MTAPTPELWQSHVAGLVVALAVGMLIGVGRERRKGTGGAPSDAAGVRTFALVSLIGAIAAMLQSQAMLVIMGAGVIVLNALSYRRFQSEHPGQTTEFALLATFAIGFMAISKLELAAGLGVGIALLLNSKSRLHTFAVSQLSERELDDATLLAGAALIILPLLPDRAIDPLGVVNLQVVWRLTILMLGVNALGYVARRTLGPQVGLAVAGLCGGFVSSILAIAALGRQAHADPAVLRSAVAGGAFSSIATAVELLIILALTNIHLLQFLGPGIAAMGIVAAAYGGAFAMAAHHAPTPAAPALGRAFEPKLAVVFAGGFALMLLIAALLQRWLGPSGAEFAIALGGFMDTHAATASAARLAASGTLYLPEAAFAALLAITSNTLVKMASAFAAGGRDFAVRLCPSHAAMIAALWLGWYLVRAGVIFPHGEF
jgi:uncharacterized membrane protein (DUF4010 family)